MRHVTRDVPTREDLLAGIERPERFRPDPVLVKPIPWRRRSDGAAEVQDLRTGEYVPLHDATVEVYEGLERGLTFDDILQRALVKSPKPLPDLLETTLRAHLLDLSLSGYVDLKLDPAPDVFEGRYERVKELGRGGMGIVHLCRDRKTDRLVVVKHAWGWLRRIERAEHTNRWEAAVLASLDHPSVPRLLDAFEVGGILHVVREQVDGTPLQSMAKELLAMVPRERARIVADLARAMRHVHDRGFLYLDAKPSNFLHRPGDAPAIIDFGVAKLLADGASSVRVHVGSPGYTSPEVRREKTATRLSDQYGLGCVHFFMATGGRARRGWGPEGIREALERARVGRAERAVIERMTAWDARDRFASLADAIAALEAVS